MDIIKIVEDIMKQNTYIVIEEETKTAVIIDAGASVDAIEEHLNMFNTKPEVKAVLLTHAHYDHIRNLDNILKKYKCKAYICQSGKQMLYDTEKNLSCLDENPFVIKDKKNIKTFVDGDTLTFGNLDFICYNTPGHSVDSSCFVVHNHMFTGDTVFKSRFARTDLYSGDENVLRISLRRLLEEVCNDVDNFYPGHSLNFNKTDFEYVINRFLGEN